MHHDTPSAAMASAGASLDALVARAMQGDSQACAKLLLRLSHSMASGILYVFKGQRDRDDIDDVLQGCRLALLEDLELGEAPLNPRSFAFTLGANKAKQYLQKNDGGRNDRLLAPELPPGLEWTRPVVATPEHEVMMRQELVGTFQLLLPTLTEKEAQVLDLHMLQELPAPEVAGILNITPNYVHQHVSQIRKKASAQRAILQRSAGKEVVEAGAAGKGAGRGAVGEWTVSVAKWDWNSRMRAESA